MSGRSRAKLLRMAAAVPLLVGAAVLAQESGNVIRSFKATLQRHPSGRVKTVLLADSASIEEEKRIHAENVRLKMLTNEGIPECELRADLLDIDQSSQIGHSPHASFEKADPAADAADAGSRSFSIEGDGVIWYGARSQLVISSNAVITIRGGGTMMKGIENFR